MRVHIDWLTFTMPMIYFGSANQTYADAIENGFFDMFGEQLRADAFGGNWEKNERSRAPYSDAWKLRSGEITLFASPSLTHCCVEISGKGCETLIDKGVLDKVLQSCHSRCTRIDIACDIETDVMPSEFVEKLSHERMRSSGKVVSDTGETCYVGSQKSERYARVYRYFEPHPRSKLLRIEHVFRKDYAKKVAQSVGENDLVSIAKSAGEAFGWSHTIWQTEGANDVDLSVVRAESTGGGTVAWLVKSAAPAFRKLVANGTIRDPEAFFLKYFMGEE